jgi:hypothetical protein
MSERLEKAWENLKRARDAFLSWLGIRGKKEEREERPPAERQKEEGKGAVQWPQWM